MVNISDEHSLNEYLVPSSKEALTAELPASGASAGEQDSQRGVGDGYVMFR